MSPEVVLSGLLLAAVLLVCVVVVVDTLRLGAPPMPSGAAARRCLVSMLPTAPGLVCWELGAGWGGLAVAIAEARPTWTVVAWEAAWVPWLVCALRVRVLGPSNVHVRRGDVLSQDLGEARVLTTYLLGTQTEALRVRLGAHPGPWTLLSVHFALRGVVAAREARAQDLHRTPVIVYESEALDGP